MQLHQSLHHAAVPALANVLVVSFAPPEHLARWLTAVLFDAAPREWFSQTRFVANPDLSIYHAYGLGRNARWRVYSPKILLHYAWLQVRGKRLPKTNQDPLQRGGDFVVVDGRIRLSYVGRDQSDRPSVEKLIAMLKQRS